MVLLFCSSDGALVTAVAYCQGSGVGGWKAPTHVLAPTDALVEIAIPHLVGGRLSLKVALAGQPFEFEVLTMGALAVAGHKRCGFKEGRLAYGEMTARGFVNSAILHTHTYSEPFVLTAAWERGR